jgi:hypothetical protein
MVVHFSPTIHVTNNGAAGSVKEQVNEGLRLSMREFEQMLASVESGRQRKAMA